MTSTTDGSAGAAARERFAPRALLRTLIGPAGLALTVAIALFFIGGFLAPGFVSGRQVVNLLTITAILALVSAGQTLVIISGGDGIDLSVGPMLTFSAILTAMLSGGANGGALMAIVVTVVICTIIGLLNGVGIVLLRFPPIIATLAMGGVLGGLSFVLSNGTPRGGAPPALVAFVNAPMMFSLSAVTLLMVIFGAALWMLTRRTSYGMALYAVGSNRSAARWAGYRVRLVVAATYGLSGLFGGVGGVVLLGYANGVNLNLGASYTLLSVAAVVIGGVLLSGGVGGYWGTMAGALLLTVLTGLLTALDLDPAVRQICYGTIFMAMLLLYGRERGLRQ